MTTESPRRRGRPRTPVDPQIMQWLDDSYANRRSLMIPLSRDHADAPAMLRTMRIYAEHRGLGLDAVFVEHGGMSKLRFRMRAKRVYKTRAKDAA